MCVRLVSRLDTTITPTPLITVRSVHWLKTFVRDVGSTLRKETMNKQLERRTKDRIEAIKIILQGNEPDCGYGEYLRELNYLEGLISQ